MIVATNADGKMVAAGWFNVRPDANIEVQVSNARSAPVFPGELGHSACITFLTLNKEEKKDLKAFYRDCVGYQIQMLTKDDKAKFNAMEWVS
jgi:hypothetical protein